MSRITTHILDLSIGRPAAGVAVVLIQDDVEMYRGFTDANGRIPEWTVDAQDIYKLRFATGDYYRGKTLYPFIEISFNVTDEGHYHIPLLLSPHGYSTYRGS